MAEKRAWSPTKPLWGYTWQDWQKFAHRYGAGSVTVYPKNEDMVPATAKSVAMWNDAVGLPVFHLSDDPTADIIISFHGDTPVEEDGMQKMGDATPFTGPTGRSRGHIRTYNWGWMDPNTIAHELGHTLGLAHPDTPITEARGTYADPRFLMSGAKDVLQPDLNPVAPAEAARVRQTTSYNTATQENRVDQVRNTTNTEPPKKKKKPEPVDHSHQQMRNPT